MVAINTAPGREATPPPWPRLRPAIGLIIAFAFLGFYGVQIGEPVDPPLMIDTAAPEADSPLAEFVLANSTSRDFQIVVRTGMCTVAEYSWEPAAGGPKNSTSNERCSSSHILTPTAGITLSPDTDYLVTATFTNEEGVKSSFEYEIATTPRP